MTGIIMAFDFGIRNIGIAVGQQLTYTTQPIKVLKSKDGIPDWKKINYIYNEWNPIILVVGLPVQIDGSYQYITILSKKFAKQLKKRFKITVRMHDERFSSVEARSNYIEYCWRNNLRKTKGINYINAISAAVILHSWLNQHCIK